MATHKCDQNDLEYSGTGIKLGIWKAVSAGIVGVITGALIAADGENGFDEQESRGPVLIAGSAFFAMATFNEIMTLWLRHDNQNERLTLEITNAIDTFDTKIKSLQGSLHQSAGAQRQVRAAANVKEIKRQLLLHLDIVGLSLHSLAANGLDSKGESYGFYNQIFTAKRALENIETIPLEKIDITEALLDEIAEYQETLPAGHIAYGYIKKRIR